MMRMTGKTRDVGMIATGAMIVAGRIVDGSMIVDEAMTVAGIMSAVGIMMKAGVAGRRVSPAEAGGLLRWTRTSSGGSPVRAAGRIMSSAGVMGTIQAEDAVIPAAAGGDRLLREGDIPRVLQGEVILRVGPAEDIAADRVRVSRGMRKDILPAEAAGRVMEAGIRAVAGGDKLCCPDQPVGRSGLTSKDLYMKQTTRTAKSRSKKATTGRSAQSARSAQSGRSGQSESRGRQENMRGNALSNTGRRQGEMTSAKRSRSRQGSFDGNSPLEKFFLDQLKDIYYAENKIVQSLPKMAEATTTGELREAFEDHLHQTQRHVKRLEQVFQTIGQKAEGKKCEAIEGISREVEEIIDETEEGTMTRDAALIIAAQKVEHYEIATYGGLVQLAITMNLHDAADSLDKTLVEEEDTDARLTEIAENDINLGAEHEGSSASRESGSEDEMEE